MNIRLFLSPLTSGRWRASLLLGFAAIGAFSVSGCAKAVSATSLAVRPVVVRVAPVTYSTEAVPVRVSGVMARKTEADLSFKVGGVVETVLVRAGDIVQKNQVLAQLRLEEIEAQLSQARSALEKTQRNFDRVEKLQASNAVSIESLQDARTALDQAGAQMRIAEFNRRFAVITAPATGRVLRRLVEPNELVAAGRPVLGFAADEDGWLARAGLAERDVERVRPGDPVEIALPGAAGGRCLGRVAHISEATDPTTRTTQVEITLDEPPAEARSGFVVAVTIHPRAVAARPIVAASALIEGAADGASLYVVEANSLVARRVEVQVEALLGANAYLATPLSRTGQIVVTGAEFLRDGMPVEIAVPVVKTATAAVAVGTAVR